MVLDNTEYHPGSGWRIPRGVELRADHLGALDAHIMGVGPYGKEWNGAGSWDSSVTNWKLDDNRVQMVLHCQQQ